MLLLLLLLLLLLVICGSIDIVLLVCLFACLFVVAHFSTFFVTLVSSEDESGGLVAIKNQRRIPLGSTWAGPGGGIGTQKKFNFHVLFNWQYLAVFS